VQARSMTNAVAIALHACHRLRVVSLACLLIASSGAQAGAFIAGPENMMPVMASLASRASEISGMALRARTGEESSLITDVSRGKLPFAIVCRPLSDTERSSVESHLVGYDGVAVIVNGRNPVKNLETVQIAEIYTQRITRWNSVGGADKQIVPIVKETQILPRGVVGSLLPSSKTSEKGIHVVNADLPAILFVAVDPYAVGYVGIGEATRLIAEGARIKVITIGGKAPIPALMRNGAYPLSWPVYLITSRRLTEAERRIKTFLLGPNGRRAFAEAGVASVRDDKP
jgi:phosphate transport system substrate-binding protein